ncbi:hypothetical protein FGO68_gene5115 [Halteria grandinella]|uniref:TLDc domain-containing protein n=1 Tax=Halteria grandinella TaxID=5974 RepID=A0A8J8NJ24_HALGN|nr:hypothetical protein FGO68_gene5115 [Halteria grandinella]
MLQIIIAAASLTTSCIFASTVIHLENCNASLSFAQAQTPGTKFTCVNEAGFNELDCIVVISEKFSKCNQGELCKDFICKYRGEMDYTNDGSFSKSNLNLTKDEEAWLLEQIQVPGLILKPVLLFQATRDGWDISEYSSRVNGQNNTYQFFRFKGSNRRAAGFASFAKTDEEGQFKDSQSFILSIEKRIVARADSDTGCLMQNREWGTILASKYNSQLTYGVLGPSFNNNQSSTICGMAGYYMPFEDDEKKICSISGLEGLTAEIIELEVWKIL